MYCKYCGKKVSGHDIFCKNCGEQIQETENATPNTNYYAGFVNRLAAYLIDGIVIYIGGFIIGFFIGLTLVLLQITNLIDETLLNSFYQIIGIGITWLYFAIMESSSKQATLGKMAMKIKVTDLEGNRISFSRATGRYFAKILSMMIFFIGYIMAAFTEKKQALHDMIAGTLVVMDN